MALVADMSNNTNKANNIINIGYSIIVPVGILGAALSTTFYYIDTSLNLALSSASKELRHLNLDQQSLKTPLSHPAENYPGPIPVNFSYQPGTGASFKALNYGS